MRITTGDNYFTLDGDQTPLRENLSPYKIVGSRYATVGHRSSC